MMAGSLQHHVAQRAEELVLPAHAATDDDGARVEGHDQVRHAGGAGGDGLLPDGDGSGLAGRRAGLDLFASSTAPSPASRASRATPLPDPSSSTVLGAPSRQARQSMTT